VTTFRQIDKLDLDSLR
jgi:hypothetical protein